MLSALLMPFRPLVVAQIAGVLLVLVMLAFFPPMTGRIILIPLGGDDGKVFAMAFARGGSVIGRGPFAGSLVIQGHRGDMLSTLYRDHILLLAAPHAGCGGAA